MRTTSPNRQATAAWAIAAVVTLAALALEIAFRAQEQGASSSVVDVLWTMVPVPFAVLGALIVSRRSANRIGWILVFIGGAMTLAYLSDAVFFFIDGPPTDITPVLYVALWYNNFAWVTFIFPMFLLLYVFPTGHLLSRRWVWVLWWAAVPTAMMVIAPLISKEIGPTSETWTIENPIGFVSAESFEAVLVIFGMSVLILLAGGPVAMVMRFRRAQVEEREQIKWVFLGFFVFVLAWTASFVLDRLGAGGVVALILVLGILVIPTTMTIAVLRYRLFDIDVVISKTVTFGVLAAFITAVYSLVVVGVGSLVGGGDEPSLGLSIAAVAIVAVAFEPVRRRVQRWANVLVFGRRATPYEVLAGATARLSEASDPDVVLRRVAELMVDGTGAETAVVWLKVGEVMVPRASAPADAVERSSPARIDGVGSLIDADLVANIRHRGELLGALSITTQRGDAVTRSDERVLNDLAGSVGVLLRNLGLNEELASRAEQLRLSRRRLVAAQDAERRRLERDLHDGAQQQVVALKVKLGIARTLAEREGAQPVAELVGSVSDTTQDAVDAMRSVAHGIYSPLLEAEGLETAVLSARRNFGIPVEVTADNLDRYERSVEESVYFCIVGIVTGAVDAGATRVSVGLRGGASVSFSVDTDKAVEDLVAVEDRVDALGGNLSVTRRDSGITVTGELPVDVLSLERT